jgi:hypothetical protein
MREKQWEIREKQWEACSAPQKKHVPAIVAAAESSEEGPFRSTAILTPVPSQHQDHRAVFDSAFTALRPGTAPDVTRRPGAGRNLPGQVVVPIQPSRLVDALHGGVVAQPVPEVKAERQLVRPSERFVPRTAFSLARAAGAARVQTEGIP